MCLTPPTEQWFLRSNCMYRTVIVIFYHFQKKYEDYINLMYPRWKEELQHYRSQAQNDRDKFSEVGFNI